MGSELPFRHHTYTNDPAEGCYELIPASRTVPVADPQAKHVAGTPAAIRRAGVVEILLVHGTFAGHDALGFVREITRISPKAGRAIKQTAKQLFDQLAGEVGNYTQSFADCLSHLINDNAPDVVPVRLFHWSGENHHLGRADGAISLVDLLLARQWKSGDRIQIWGHSHAGNLLALMTNLLGASPATRREFFEAARPHYRNPISGRLDLQEWDRVRQSLTNQQACALSDLKFDLVTFGTPLRYRWNTDATDNLLHFVHHRPLVESCHAQAAMPTSVEDVLRARGGDYVQQLGIAGTNFMHYVFAWRSWIVERRLCRMLQPDMRRRDLLEHLRRGQRVSLDGSTLLVDYAAAEDNWKRQLAGHAVYTHHQWLPFHLREITRRFYQ